MSAVRLVIVALSAVFIVRYKEEPGRWIKMERCKLKLSGSLVRAGAIGCPSIYFRSAWPIFQQVERIMFENGYLSGYVLFCQQEKGWIWSIWFSINRFIHSKFFLLSWILYLQSSNLEHMFNCSLPFVSCYQSKHKAAYLGVCEWEI